MSDWIEAAEQATTRLGYEASSEAWAFLDGARWQREALLSDESVERAARALNAEGWTCDSIDEPGRYDDCAACRRVCDLMARVALTAAIGGDDE